MSELKRDRGKSAVGSWWSRVSEEKFRRQGGGRSARILFAYSRLVYISIKAFYLFRIRPMLGRE